MAMIVKLLYRSEGLIKGGAPLLYKNIQTQTKIMMKLKFKQMFLQVERNT